MTIDISQVLIHGKDSVTVLNKGKNKKVFCFPSIDFSMKPYLSIAMNFLEYEFHLIDFFDGEGFYERTVEYIKQNLNNKSVFLGYSAGGNIAFNIAQELANNRKPINIIMIDSWLGLENIQIEENRESLKYFIDFVRNIAVAILLKIIICSILKR